MLLTKENLQVDINKLPFKGTHLSITWSVNLIHICIIRWFFFLYWIACQQQTMRLLFDISRCTSGVHLLKRTINHSSVHRCLLLDHRKSHAAGLHVWSNGTGKPSPENVTHRGHRRSTVSVLPYSALGVLFRDCMRSQRLLEKPWTAGHTSVVFKSSSAASSKETTIKTPVESGSGQPPTTLPLDDVKRILKLAYPERLRLSGMCCLYANVMPLIAY